MARSTHDPAHAGHTDNADRTDWTATAEETDTLLVAAYDRHATEAETFGLLCLARLDAENALRQSARQMGVRS